MNATYDITSLALLGVVVLCGGFERIWGAWLGEYEELGERIKRPSFLLRICCKQDSTRNTWRIAGMVF